MSAPDEPQPELLTPQTEVTPSRPRRPWRRRLTRKRILLVGLPSLALAMAAVAVAVYVAFPSKARLRARYNHRGDVKLAARDYPAAKANFAKLVALAPTARDARYKLALATWGAGDVKQAAEIMKGLAQPDQPAFAPAYLWLAQRLLEIQPASPRAFQLAETYLKRVVEIEPKPVGATVEARVLLGKLYGLSGRAADAEASLAAVADQRPDVLVALARVCKAQGKKGEGEGWANKAAEHFRQEVAKHPEVNPARVQYAQAESDLGRFESAEAALKAGQAKPDDRSLDGALKEVYVAWYDSIRKDPANGEQRAAILERALVLDPASRTVLQRLHVSVKQPGAEGDRARALVAGLEASGKATAYLYRLFGDDAWKRGNAAEASDNWEKALRLTPDDPEVANNLAWAIAFGPEPDLPRALAMIEKSIQRWPDVVMFHDTRGFILLKMKRWKDAEPDLVLVTRSKLDRPALHLALAEIYDNMNMPDFAKLQRSYAQGPKSHVR